MMGRAALLTTLLILVSCHVALGWTGKVVRVIDGDTIVVQKGQQKSRVRLYGIDCPERAQRFGSVATAYASSMADQMTVEVTPLDQDRYGRIVALIAPENGGLTLNGLLVKKGLAWTYDRYCGRSFCSRWRKWEKDARKSKVGLWAQKRPVAPWEYRHKH